MVLFLCKQHTVYELRISDWSSDVCSSDHERGVPGLQALGLGPASGARSTLNLAHAAGGASEGWAIMRVLQRATRRAKKKAEEGSGWAGPGSTDPFDPQGGTRAADSAECRMVAAVACPRPCGRLAFGGSALRRSVAHAATAHTAATHLTRLTQPTGDERGGPA